MRWGESGTLLCFLTYLYKIPCSVCYVKYFLHFLYFFQPHVYFLSNCTSYLRNLFNVTVQYSCTTAVLNSYLRFFQEGNSMTILKCSAMTCVYNKEQLCSKLLLQMRQAAAVSEREPAVPWKTAIQMTVAATKSRSTAKPITVPIMITANVQHPPFR